MYGDQSENLHLDICHFRDEKEIRPSTIPPPPPTPHFLRGGRVLLYVGQSSIDCLVICVVIIPCQFFFVWLFLVSVLTYRAASGALAVLSSSEKVCNQIIKVLLSNILYPTYKRFSTTKRVRAFSTPLDYYAWHRASRGHETRGSGDENGCIRRTRKIVNCEGDQGYILRMVLQEQVIPSKRINWNTWIEFNRIRGGKIWLYTTSEWWQVAMEFETQ